MQQCVLTNRLNFYQSAKLSILGLFKAFFVSFCTGRILYFYSRGCWSLEPLFQRNLAESLGTTGLVNTIIDMDPKDVFGGACCDISYH